MKRLLFVFLFGQLLLLSFMFNQSIYQMYEINNLGESSLQGYIATESTGTSLSNLYDLINDKCSSKNECQLQLIKMPIAENHHIIYDIYYTQVDKIEKTPSITPNKTFNYLPLTKEDFVDSDGVFYSNLSFNTLLDLGKKSGIVIEKYTSKIDYGQLVQLNLLNFFILIIISQLVLFIYTFTRIKINTVKKVLGYSSFKMISASVKDFLIAEGIILILTLSIHFIYYLSFNQIVPRYFYLLLLFLLVIILINVLLLLFTQISLKFIDINLMIKNKVYSNKLNYSLNIVKILLILSITISTSSFISDYQTYKIKVENLDVYSKLSNYFVSNGFNYDEASIMRRNKDTLEEHGIHIKELYNYFDERNQLYVHNVSSLVDSLASFSLERRGINKEEIYEDINRNYIVVNDSFLTELVRIKNEQGKEIIDFNKDKPTILVPIKHKDKEKQIVEVYTEKYNELLSYNRNYGLSTSNVQVINKINIIYIKNNQEIEMLGKNIDDDGSSLINLKDTIFILDKGDFGSLYYSDIMNRGSLIFHLDDRDEFSKVLAKFNLNKIVIAGTLLTPFMTSIHNAKFFMYNSLVFSTLFLLTLIFVLYISNYVDITSNSRKYAIKYINGFGLFKTFKSQIFVYCILLSGLFISLLTENFSIPFYVSILMVDIFIMILLYKIIIIKDIHKHVKGG